jgi:hypothetical protein
LKACLVSEVISRECRVAYCLVVVRKRLTMVTRDTQHWHRKSMYLGFGLYNWMIYCTSNAFVYQNFSKFDKVCVRKYMVQYDTGKWVTYIGASGHLSSSSSARDQQKEKLTPKLEGAKTNDPTVCSIATWSGSLISSLLLAAVGVSNPWRSAP